MIKHPLFTCDLLNDTRQATCSFPSHGPTLEADTSFNTLTVPLNVNEQDYFKGLPVQDMKAYGEAEG
jgi:hypothetical protein